MKRTLTTAALATSIILASLSAALGAEGTHRYRIISEPTRFVEVRVTGSQSTWLTGTNAKGEELTVVFLPRFASILRGRTRVPVSYLKPGDTVRVEGRMRDRRFAATSAQLIEPSLTAARVSEAR